MKRHPWCGWSALGLAALLAPSLAACSSAPPTSSEDKTGLEASASKHIISRESGLSMVAEFASARSCVAPALARGLASDTRYEPHAVREVLEQDGTRQAFASLGLNVDGSTTITLRALDGAGRLLPKALANGQVTGASEATALFARVEGDSDGASQSLVRESSGTLIQGWRYDASAFLTVASQPEAESLRLALGQNAAGEPTIVLLAESDLYSEACMAADNGTPSPPY